MAIKYQIEIEISEDGQINLTTHGAKGPQCEEEIKPIEKALGKASQRKRTSEFYEKQNSTRRTTTKTS